MVRPTLAAVIACLGLAVGAATLRAPSVLAGGGAKRPPPPAPAPRASALPEVVKGTSPLVAVVGKSPPRCRYALPDGSRPRPSLTTWTATIERTPLVLADLDADGAPDAYGLEGPRFPYVVPLEGAVVLPVSHRGSAWAAEVSLTLSGDRTRVDWSYTVPSPAMEWPEAWLSSGQLQTADADQLAEASLRSAHAMLRHLNELRLSHGLVPLAYDAEASRGVLLHSVYQLRLGEMGHEEHPSPWTTEEGTEAAARTAFAFGWKPQLPGPDIGAVHDFYRTPIHRLHPFRKDARRAGAAAAGNVRGIRVLLGEALPWNEPAVSIPAPLAMDVPTEAWDEVPMPYPTDPRQGWVIGGTPITLAFTGISDVSTVDRVTGELWACPKATPSLDTLARLGDDLAAIERERAALLPPAGGPPLADGAPLDAKRTALLAAVRASPVEVRVSWPRAPMVAAGVHANAKENFSIIGLLPRRRLEAGCVYLWVARWTDVGVVPSEDPAVPTWRVLTGAFRTAPVDRVPPDTGDPSSGPAPGRKGKKPG